MLTKMSSLLGHRATETEFSSPASSAKRKSQSESGRGCSERQKNSVLLRILHFLLTGAPVLPSMNEHKGKAILQANLLA